MFYKDERLALFIDGSNLYAAARALGFDIDYKLLRSEFMRRGKLLRAFYYTALLENDEYSPIRPLVDWLHYNGYSMVTKPAKEFVDAQGRRKVKGNMDIELYNLEKDIREEYNVADQYPEVVDSIRTIMAREHMEPELEKFKMDPLSEF